MTKWVLILLLSGRAGQPGSVTAEFDSWAACHSAGTIAAAEWIIAADLDTRPPRFFCAPTRLPEEKKP